MVPSRARINCAAALSELSAAGGSADRGDVLIVIELRGGRRRGDESAALGIERAVRDAEGVAAEDAPVRLIHDGVVVQGVSGHVNELERPVAEPHALAVLDRPHTL